MRGGNNAATNTSSQAGAVLLIPGASTGSTQGLQGLLMLGAVYTGSGSNSTPWRLQCPVAASDMEVQDCALASSVHWLGVAELVNTNTVQVITGGQVLITATAAVTRGHTLCASSSAPYSRVTDSGGAAACATPGTTVGVVVATGGTWTSPDGTSLAASPTLPLVQLMHF
jgi:hypothetical protein